MTVGLHKSRLDSGENRTRRLTQAIATIRLFYYWTGWSIWLGLRLKTSPGRLNTKRNELINRLYQLVYPGCAHCEMERST